MVALDMVRASNAQLKDLGPNLVAVFVGGTSGIGEATLKAFVKYAFAPRVYIIGRSQDAADRIIEECKKLNGQSSLIFHQADVTELLVVNRVCDWIKSKEPCINLLVQSQGNLNMRGRDESPEGLDRKFTLNYYSRMMFIKNLLPELRQATQKAPHFARTLSILGAGTEGKVNFEDLDLKYTFSRARCAAHTIVMNDFMMEEFATKDPAISFVHSFPSIVNTGIARELPSGVRMLTKVVLPLFAPFTVSKEETGERQLFIATSGLYPPATPEGSHQGAKGVEVPWGPKLMANGADGKEGSGAYLVNWNNETTGKIALLKEYREKGAGTLIWDHTTNIFAKVLKQVQVEAETSQA